MNCIVLLYPQKKSLNSQTILCKFPECGNAGMGIRYGKKLCPNLWETQIGSGNIIYLKNKKKDGIFFICWFGVFWFKYSTYWRLICSVIMSNPKLLLQTYVTPNDLWNIWRPVEGFMPNWKEKNIIISCPTLHSLLFHIQLYNCLRKLNFCCWKGGFSPRLWGWQVQKEKKKICCMGF